MKFLLFKNYLETIKKSVDSRIFQNIWIKDNNEEKDILLNGKRSCGLHVSGILLLFNLIKEKHATVKGTIKDMINYEWKEINEPKIGSVIYWEEWNQGGSPSEHIGFYIGDNKAVSNSWETKTPVIHHWTYNNQRGVKAIYWNKKLENESL
ncbi:MAG: hypothetical protein WD607_07070 [Candidatus Paceibacterota bacterium]